MNTDFFNNIQIVTIAVARLGGLSRFIDSEDVAVYVNQIAPGRFNWRKYPEYIDLSAVNYALQDAKKQRYGHLLTGDSKKGWMLSPAGATWINSLPRDNFEVDKLSAVRRNSITESQHAEAARLLTTNAVRLYQSGKRENISHQDFYEFARINEYFQSRARERRFTIIDTAVVGDELLSEIWSFLKSRFCTTE